MKEKQEVVSETNCNCPACFEIINGQRLMPNHELCQNLIQAQELITEVITDYLRTKIRTGVIQQKIFEFLREDEELQEYTDDHLWHVIGSVEGEKDNEPLRQFIDEIRQGIDENKLDDLILKMRAQVSARMPEAIENLVVKLAFEAELLVQKMEHEENGERYMLPDEFRQLLVHDNQARKVKEVFETGRGLTKIQRGKALSRYESLCSAIKKALDYHDSSYDAYCASRNRHSREEWREIWATTAEMIYPDLPKDILNSLSLPNRPIVAEIARQQVAMEYKRSSSYMEKILSKARSENLAKSSHNDKSAN